MGCDIHIYAETELPDGTWHLWKSYGAANTKCFSNTLPPGIGSLFYRVRSRDYGFFAALANVRGPGMRPKGLPPDVSAVVKREAERWGVDGHSHSWLNAEDFCKLFVEHKLTDAERAEWAKQRVSQSSQWWGAPRILYEYLDIDCDETPIDNIRFVFWFDN